MILHFHAADVQPGESAYLNICTDPENYNFNIYPDVHYIEVSREDLDRIYKELDFNMFWHMDDLETDHSTAAALLDTISRQAKEAQRDDLTDDEIINNRFL